MSNSENFINPTPQNHMEFERLKQKKVYINSHSAFFMYATIAIIAIGFVAGIICGSTFSIPEVKMIKIYPETVETVEKFNVGMMFIIWASTAITALASWAVRCILESLDGIHCEIKRSRMYTEYSIDSQNKEQIKQE